MLSRFPSLAIQSIPTRAALVRDAARDAASRVRATPSSRGQSANLPAGLPGLPAYVRWSVQRIRCRGWRHRWAFWPIPRCAGPRESRIAASELRTEISSRGRMPPSSEMMIRSSETMIPSCGPVTRSCGPMISSDNQATRSSTRATRSRGQMTPSCKKERLGARHERFGIAPGFLRSAYRGGLVVAVPFIGQVLLWRSGAITWE